MMRQESTHQPATSECDGTGADSDQLPTALGTVRDRYRDVIADTERLDALHQLGLMDTEPDRVFEDITDLLRLHFGVEVARIHFLDDIRQWVYVAAGDPVCETLGTQASVCQYTIRQYRTLVVSDLLADPEFADNPVVVNSKRMRFYAGAPLTTADGQNIGVICLMDPEPRPGLAPAAKSLLERMAALTIHAMEMRQRHADTRLELVRAVDQEPITGLLSRRGLQLRLQRLIDDAASANQALGVLELRLGRIDRVEQAYGTSVTNQLLRDIAERLSGAIETGEILGRPDDYGFIMVCPLDAADPASVDERLAARADGLAEALSAPLTINGEPFDPVVHIGVARAPTDGGYAHELITIAHDAVLRAARQPSGGTAWPDRAAIAAQRRQLSLEGRLRRAVDEDAFSVFYQPIVSLQDGGRVVGAEALLRWPQPEGESPIGPDVFIPLAEELGLMDRIGLSVFETSCHQLRRWQDQPGSEAFWVSVNLAPAQLQDPELPSQFLTIARQAGVAPGDIKLEITESGFENGFKTALPVIEALAAAGFPLALDDFGTGHSSLSRLITLPFQVLKVDRSFVNESPDGPGAAVVSSLNQLARSLHLQSLGEGVENDAHENYLRDTGYQFAQGYYYSRPLPAAEFEAWRGARA